MSPLDLIDTPFSQSPNPNTLYLTPSLKSKLQKVRFTINARQGLSAFLGDVGLGKSTMLRYLFTEYAAREDVHAALMVAPGLFPSDFAMLKGMCQDLEIETERSLQKQLGALSEFLVQAYSQKRNVVVFVDEADRMNFKKLELLRSILNYETDKHKLIQFVIAGQLELLERLKKADYKALTSRVFSASLLDELSARELASMIDYRCNAADIANPFSPDALARLYSTTRGNPRTALRICAAAYETMRESDGTVIDLKMIEEAEHSAMLLLPIAKSEEAENPRADAA